MASKRELRSISHGTKGFFYLGGLTEGFETILFMIVICLFPGWFVETAIFFGVLCWLTTLGRFTIAIQNLSD